MRLYTISKIFLFVVFITVFYCTTAAQEKNEIILTWQANNFFPSSYLGKALTTQYSPVSVAVELISAGKLTDLSKYQISWYLDGKYLSRGDGLKESVFLAKKTKGETHVVRVEIKNGNSILTESVSVPVFAHTLVLESPYPKNIIKPNTQISLKAMPYFFNLDTFNDLSFFWQVNGEKESSGTNNALILNIGAPTNKDDSVLEIVGSTQNIKNPMEFAKQKIWLTIQ